MAERRKSIYEDPTNMEEAYRVMGTAALLEAWRLDLQDAEFVVSIFDKMAEAALQGREALQKLQTEVRESVLQYRLLKVAGTDGGLQN